MNSLLSSANGLHKQLLNSSRHTTPNNLDFNSRSPSFGKNSSGNVIYHIHPILDTAKRHKSPVQLSRIRGGYQKSGIIPVRPRTHH
mmetsp:Transcript_23988/g.41076  ORF Transcript_23988/g.41076 Transcript_23988/m.41076 type:complete len:86 (-) Transcript_23988:645-902(-)